MNLDAKDKLISDLIKENPDATIRDYLEVVKEIEQIETADTMGVDQAIRKRWIKVRNTMYCF
jgi:hypothetical protein